MKKKVYMTGCNITVPNVFFFSVEVPTHHYEAETDKSKDADSGDVSDCRLKDISDMNDSKKLNDSKSEMYL